MARIKPTDPIMPILAGQGTRVYGTGIPLKLELASRFLSAIMAQSEIPMGMFKEETIKRSLDIADELINEYNKQQEGKS